MHIFTDKHESEKEESLKSPVIPEELPILPLRGTVVYPLTMIPLSVGQARSIRLVDDATTGNRIVGLVALKDPAIEEGGPDDVYWTGTAATIVRLLRAPDDSVRLIVQAIDRIRIKEFTAQEPYLKARVDPAPENAEKTVEVKALMVNTVELFKRYVTLTSHFTEEVLMAVMNIDDPRQLIYALAGNVLHLELKDAQELLELDNVADKLKKFNTWMTKEVEVLELGKKLQTQTHDEMSKTQRDYEADSQRVGRRGRADRRGERVRQENCQRTNVARSGKRSQP